MTANYCPGNTCRCSKAQAAPFTAHEDETAKEGEIAECPQPSHVLDRLRLAQRILNLWTNTSQSISVSIWSRTILCSYPDSQGLIELHTP